ncbi:MAG: Kelch repeat-containing protein [Bacteroidales bacterium]
MKINIVWRFYLIVILLLFISIVSSYPQSNQVAGIKFNSQNVERSEKTSIFLNEGKPIELANSFSISFDISFWDFRKFGPIFRIEDEKRNEIRVNYIQFKNKDTSYIQIIEPFQKASLEIKIPKKHLTRNHWFNFKLTIDQNNKSLKAFLNNDLEGELSYPIEKQNQFKFVFGIKELNNFNDFDVPAIIVKNIIISENEKIKYQWDLNPFKENPLADKFENLSIKAINPIWYYKDYQKWKHVADFKIADNSSSCLGVAFDSLHSRLFIDRKKDLLIYDLISGKDSIIKYDSPSPAYWNELFYDDEKQFLYSFMNGMGKISIFDLRKNKWIVTDTSKNTSGHYFGSVKFSYPKEDDIYLLGGYGWYSVKNDLFKYNFNQRKWVKVSLKKNEMTPRAWFSFGKGFNDGEYIIYGGFGNESGKQEDGFKNFNDFFLLNLNDTTLTKIKYPSLLSINYSALANYLYLDSKDSTVFFLSKIIEDNIAKIYLNKLNLRTGKASKVGNIFWKTKGGKWLYHYLHYNKTTNEFISVIFDSTTVELYSINYPPISDTAKVFIEETKTQKNYSTLLLAIITGTAVIGFSFIIYKKRKTKVSQTANKNGYGNEIFIPESNNTKNAIKLFGGLQIYDKNGDEIAQTLSPKLKELFLLILLRSLSNHHRGITSEELSSIIWPDASPGSAKSNRGVAINKIRNRLSAVEGLKLEFSDKRWFIKMDNGSRCDYADYLKFCNASKKAIGFENKSIDSLINIVDGGEFLKGISYEWLDSIKFAVNNEIIKSLKLYFDDHEIQNNAEKLIQLCDVILTFDSVDQDAIKIKIKTLSSTGKHHIAKSTFDLFVAEYKRLYDENYPLTFQEIINS